MEAGIELDELVAEKVMGWKKIDLTRVHFDTRGLKWMWDKKEGYPYSEVQKTPEYSRDIAAAWEVVEKLKSKGFLFAVNTANDWEVEFNLNEGRFLQNGDTIGMGRASTAPHAICLAALKAYEAANKTARDCEGLRRKSPSIRRS